MSEPSEYVPDNPKSVPQLSSENAWAFSVTWTGLPNVIGIKPPNPQFQATTPVSYILPQTIVASSTQYGKAPIGIIQSRREPYAVDFYNNPYGLLNSRLGTNLGA